MLIVGLTGGIGSGKSTVANLFAEYNVPIIDADLIARELTKPKAPAFLPILNHFGQTLLLEDGTLDRGKLRNIVFENPNEKRWLETLLHPLILTEMKNQISNLKTPYCIAVIPLLLEAEPFPLINRILVVDTSEHLQIKRVAIRDKVGNAHVEKIIRSQAKREHRLSKAHDVIVNDHIIADLKPQVEKLHQKYLSLALKKE